MDALALVARLSGLILGLWIIIGLDHVPLVAWIAVALWPAGVFLAMIASAVHYARCDGCGVFGCFRPFVPDQPAGPQPPWSDQIDDELYPRRVRLDDASDKE